MTPDDAAKRVTDALNAFHEATVAREVPKLVTEDVVAKLEQALEVQAKQIGELTDLINKIARDIARGFRDGLQP